MALLWLFHCWAGDRIVFVPVLNIESPSHFKAEFIGTGRSFFWHTKTFLRPSAQCHIVPALDAVAGLLVPFPAPPKLPKHCGAPPQEPQVLLRHFVS